MSIFIYNKNDSTIKEVAILCHHLSTVAQNMYLLMVSWFKPEGLYKKDLGSSVV